MTEPIIFEFETDISAIHVPSNLNDPFGVKVPEIAKVAASELQRYIGVRQKVWGYDFDLRKGKMFGVLVVRLSSGNLRYLAAVSGRLDKDIDCREFVPSVFDDATEDYFINRGMSRISEITERIKSAKDSTEIERLKVTRKKHSTALQVKLFSNYEFVNKHEKRKSLLQIFEEKQGGLPPSAAGECSAPKLLNYAFASRMKPIAIGEFWWGNSKGNRKQGSFYPACESRCRLIIEYILES